MSTQCVCVSLVCVCGSSAVCSAMLSCGWRAHHTPISRGGSKGTDGPSSNHLGKGRSSAKHALDSKIAGSGELQTSLLSLGHNDEFRRECPWCRGLQWRSVALKLGAEALLDEAKVLIISIS